MYKIVNGEYSPNNYTSSKMSIGAIIENPKMLKFVPDHLKTKNMFKNAVEKLPFIIRYVRDQYKAQEMCNK